MHQISANPIYIKAQIEPKTVIVGYFNTSLTLIDTSFRQKNQQTSELSNTIDQMDLTAQ
jgi:hypothetical protein